MAHIHMLTKMNHLYVFFLLLFCLFLCQCTTAVNSPEPIVVNKKLVDPYQLETSTYLTKAKNQDGPEKQTSIILAAGRLISDGKWQQGEAILSQTSHLTAEQRDERNLLLAKIELIRGKPQNAFKKLSQINNAQQLSEYHQIQYHELLARVYSQLSNPIKSIRERIQLENLLVDDDSRMTNRRLLWFTLIGLSQDKLTAELEQPGQDTVLKGWIDLRLRGLQFRENSKSLLTALDHWQTQYPNHPGHYILPDPLDRVAGKITKQPQHIALLLPLSGPLAGPGASVREGFMAASQSDSNQSKAHIKVYDSAKGEIVELYQQAINEGAEFVVGPLTKNQVASVAGIPHPVPTLLLNDTDVAAQDNSYTFSLSPTNEARQVALKAYNQGYGRALIIAPKNEWGNEVAKAFTQQWQAKGAVIVDTYSYSPSDDLNKTMQDFLQITASQKREKQLKQQLGYHLQALPSRRQDFDMIFLLAYPSKARQIMPLLKYYFAGNVPVYATSSVYAGNANALKDKDLDGIVFCDIPWVFSHQMGAKNWPEQFNSYNRLYALGVDSYQLATQLNQLLLFPADGNKEQNGVFYLSPAQQVAQVLEWGQFRQGLVYSLGDAV